MLSAWRQGSVVTPKDVAKVLQANVDHAPEPAVDCEADRLLVISQDCDLTHHALKDEPWAEFLPIRRLDDYDKVRDNPCRYGKNPRRLVFAEMEGVREVWYWTEPHSRFRVPRQVLAGLGPDPNRSFVSERVRPVVAWMARRYTRAALADAFNARLKTVAKQLDKLWKGSTAEAVSGCYVLGAHAELPPTESYRIRLILAVTTQAARVAAGMDAATQVEQELTQILGGCPGIDIDDIRIDPEEDLTLADLRHYQRMDLDYRSGSDRPMAAGPADEHP